MAPASDDTVLSPAPLAGLSATLSHSLRWARGIGMRMGQKRLLRAVSWAAGGLALLLLFCAIAMDSWLFTVERELDEASNATFLITLHSGLWRVCKKQRFMKDVGKNTQWNLTWLVHDYHFENCSHIPHFQQRSKESGELKPTESILWLLALCLGGGCGLAACWGRRPRRRLLFLSGGACVVSGILTLIGIVLYVGSVSLAFDSLSGPLRVETRYVYYFGAAFRLCIGAFVLSEFAGVFVIHLFLAGQRHRQNQRNKARIPSCNMVNSVSTDLFSPSRIPTATTSIAQISLTENCLDKTKSEDVPFFSINCRPAVAKINHFPLSNHVTNPMRVKVVPVRLRNTENRASEVAAHSLEAIKPMEVDNSSDLEDTVRWAPMKRRRLAEPSVGSVNSAQYFGRLRRGNARSAVNIRAEEEVPDFIPQPKSPHGLKYPFYYSCRECEHIAKQQNQHLQRHQQQNAPFLRSERSSALLPQTATSESTSTASSKSVTPSLSASCSSSCDESEEKLSDKSFSDPSSGRLLHSPCLRQRGSLLSEKRPAGGGSSKALMSMAPQRAEDSLASESDQREAEFPSTAVCHCPNAFSCAETALSRSYALGQSPPRPSATPSQTSKRRAQPYQQVTSI